MNLQVTVPLQKCIYDCPFCIAKQLPSISKERENIYEKDFDTWEESLEQALINNDIQTVVITGENDPTQSLDYCSSVVSTVRWVNKLYNKNITVELQTKCLDYKEIYEYFDVVCYSIVPNTSLINFLPPVYALTRFVVLGLNTGNPLYLEQLSKVDNEVQVTVKAMQEGILNNKYTEFTRKYKMNVEELKKWEEKGINVFGKERFRVDYNCMDTVGRYLIFREDCQIYTEW